MVSSVKCFWAVATGVVFAVATAPAEAQRGGRRPSSAEPAGSGQIQVAWATSFEGAVKEAAERHVPIFIAFIQDGEEANERLVTALGDRGVEKGLQSFVAIIASLGVHGERDEARGERTVKVCSRYGSLSCSDHQGTEKTVRLRFFGTDIIQTPMIFLCAPSGEEMDRKIIDTDISTNPVDIKQMLAAVAGKVGRGLKKPEYDRYVDLRKQAERAMKAGAFGEAGAAYATILECDVRCPLIEDTAAKLDSLEARGAEAVAQAEELVSGGRAVEGIARFEEIARQYEGLRAGKAARDRIAKLSRDPRVKEALAKAKREEMAAKMLETAKEALAKKDPSKAAKLLEKILEKYADTAAAEEARALLKEIGTATGYELRVTGYAFRESKLVTRNS